MGVNEVNADSVKIFRKLVAAPDLIGNYYLALTRSEGAIVVTLAVKDPKGMKVLSRGKSIRKELGNAKFSRGSIQFVGSKLILLANAGNIPDGTILQRFKKGFGDKTLDRFLKRVRIGSEDADVIDEYSADSKSFAEEIAKVIASEGEDLESLIRDQGEIASLQSKLTQILSSETDDEALNQSISEECATLNAIFIDYPRVVVERSRIEALEALKSPSQEELEELKVLKSKIDKFIDVNTSIATSVSHSGLPVGFAQVRIPQEMIALLGRVVDVQERTISEKISELRSEYSLLTRSMEDQGLESTDKEWHELNIKRKKYRKQIDDLEDKLSMLTDKDAGEPTLSNEVKAEIIDRLVSEFNKMYSTHATYIFGQVIDYNAKASPPLKFNVENSTPGVGAHFSHDAINFVIRPLSETEALGVCQTLYLMLPSPTIEDRDVADKYIAKIVSLVASEKTRELILDVLNYGSLKSVMAEGLKIDPAFEPRCRELLIGECQSDWFILKDWLLKGIVPRSVQTKIEGGGEDPTPADPKQFMWQMFLWRQKYSFEKLKSLVISHGGVVIVKSVGSTNLTSDIDITLSSSNNSGEELDVTREFNTFVQGDLQTMPGVALDVNCYPKDFLPVKDNQIEMGLMDGGVIEAVTILTKKNQVDQDRAALIKMRQYMSQTEWDEYVTHQAESPTFKDCDDEYFMNIYALSAQSVSEYNRRVDLDDSIRDEEMETLVATFGGVFGVPNPFPEGEDNSGKKTNLQNLYDYITHNLSDVVLQSRYELYLAQMSNLRESQKETRILSAQLTTEGPDAFLELVPELREGILKLSTLAEDSFLEALSNEEQMAFQSMAPKNKLKFLCLLEIDRRHEKAKSDCSQANFFAPEAYTSEGSLNHIVYGKQSNNPAILKRLKPEHYLESINEQTGDFLKDCHHYSSNKAECFYQTSKYLGRLFEGIVKLSERPEDGFSEILSHLNVLNSFTPSDPMSIQIEIEKVLLPMRGSQGIWAQDEKNIVEEGEMYSPKDIAAIEEVQNIFKVSEIDDFKKVILALSTEINLIVRQLLS